MGIFKSIAQSPTTDLPDTARDAGNWSEAREGYEKFLRAFPKRHDIWVQLGHMRKELGDLSGAEAAYRQSLALNADVADTHVQLGHALKLLGRHEEAIDAYTSATGLDQTLAAAWRELRSYGVEVEQVRSSKPRVLFDLSDVFFYLKHHSTVSGIQRVQLGLSASLMKITGAHAEITFLTEREDHSGYVEVQQDLISTLIRTLKKSHITLAELQSLAVRAAAEGMHYSPVRGDMLLVLGAFWVLPNIIEQIIVLKRSGVRVGVMIHDIIPISHPEFCEKDLTDTFNLYIRSTLKVVDMIISISENTQNEVRRLLIQEGIPLPEMFVLRNAHASWDNKSVGRVAKPSIEVAEVLRSDYVLYVSTIEIRKNHTLLFRVWKRLAEAMGERTPTLVFVGRPGWRVKDLMDQIVGTDYLDGRIAILHDIPDTDLERLYRGAMFTVFPSFEEGWGLPVGESLIFGRPCVASNTSSIPEVGGDFVDYINPFNVDEAFALLKKMVQDKPYLDARVRNIAENFKPRTWDEAASELVEKLDKFIGTAAVVNDDELDGMVPILSAGKTHIVGHQDRRSDYINSGLGSVVHFLFDEHWYPVENHGRWLNGGRGSVTFKVQDADETPIRVTLTLSTPSWYTEVPVHVFVGDTALKPFVPASGAKTTILFDAKPQGGKIAIELFVKGKVAAGQDPRTDLSIGLSSIAYAAQNDLGARLALVEEVLQSRPDIVKLEARK